METYCQKLEANVRNQRNNVSQRRRGRVRNGEAWLGIGGCGQKSMKIGKDMGVKRSRAWREMKRRIRMERFHNVISSWEQVTD